MWKGRKEGERGKGSGEQLLGEAASGGTWSECSVYGLV